jgi:hypothetical protein
MRRAVVVAVFLVSVSASALLMISPPRDVSASDLSVIGAAGWKAESDQEEAFFGDSVASAGDVNGDGYDDAIVGAPQYDNGQSVEGRAYAYYGSDAGLGTTANWIAESDQAGAYFGTSVAGAGDVNGDGYDDVIVGAWGYSNGQTSEGRAFVYHGSAAGLITTPNWTAESNQASALFGISVAGAGDVNRDGYDDAIVGALQYDNGQSTEGRAYAYYGSATGLSSTPNWTAESNQSRAYFGTSVDGAGDVNGDGYDEVIVGAPFYRTEGRAFAYYGSAAGLSTIPNWSVRAGAAFGFSVAGAGDVNGDGYGDAIVGARDYSHGEAVEGAAFAYHGSVAGLSTTPDWRAESNQAQAWFGTSVAGAGDVNWDGYDDAIVGASFYDHGQMDEGAAFVFCGSAGGIKISPCRTGESNQPSAWFGTSVAGAGDVNGDGYDERIMGAPRYDHGQTDEGVAFLQPGGPS